MPRILSFRRIYQILESRRRQSRNREAPPDMTIELSFDCCLYCIYYVEPGTSEIVCKPEELMTAKMVGKCSGLTPLFLEKSNPVAYEYYISKFKLEIEDETS